MNVSKWQCQERIDATHGFGSGLLGGSLLAGVGLRSRSLLSCGSFGGLGGLGFSRFLLFVLHEPICAVNRLKFILKVHEGLAFSDPSRLHLDFV